MNITKDILACVLCKVQLLYPSWYCIDSGMKHSLIETNQTITENLIFLQNSKDIVFLLCCLFNQWFLTELDTYAEKSLRNPLNEETGWVSGFLSFPSRSLNLLPVSLQAPDNFYLESTTNNPIKIRRDHA